MNAEAVVDKLEVFDICADDAVIPLRILRKPSPHFLVKIILAVKPRESVIFQVVDHGGGFPQLDNAGDPVEHHIGVIGLGQKVRGAVGKGGNLVLNAVTVGHDNDGDNGQLG